MLQGPGIQGCILAAYVDDFAYCGTYQWERTVVYSLKKTFKISTSARGAFRYVGLNVLQSKKGIKVDQNSYIAKIQPINLESDRTKEIDSELSKDEVSKIEIDFRSTFVGYKPN